MCWPSVTEASVGIIRSYFADMTNDEFFHYYKENCQIEEYEL